MADLHQRSATTQKDRLDVTTDVRIAVLGIGNVLMLDEGLGPRVVAELNARVEFPPGVEVLDRATMGMALLAEMPAWDVMLVIDAVDNTGLAPGTVLSFAPEDIAAQQVFHGAHDTRFSDVLQAAALLGYQVEGHCLGAQVANMAPADYQIGLTPAVEAALPLLMHAALDFLAQRGVRAVDRKSGRAWDGER
ncbi:MAG: hydrogenase maturation protease, partial [Coriobacteriales bacterium]|nr:hydrogenase maturation protease [Coriobacteriales bacterium]